MKIFNKLLEIVAIIGLLLVCFALGFWMLNGYYSFIPWFILVGAVLYAVSYLSTPILWKWKANKEKSKKSL